MRIDHRGDSRWSLRIGRLRLLAHFHRLAPAVDRVNVRVLRRQRVDVNAPAIQPVAYHYLRASIEALGARERPVLDDFAIAVSCLNAACALAVMNAHASGRAIDREIVQRSADGERRRVTRRRTRIAWLGVTAAGGRSGGAEGAQRPHVIASVWRAGLKSRPYVLPPCPP